MKHLNRLSAIALAGLIAGAATLSSCNEEKDSDLYLSPINLAVTAFKLKSNLGNQELDSVYFSIDLNKGLIFNADSLRKGTDISKVVANITFQGTVSEAKIVMEGGTTRTGEIDYKENPTDSIDFTGNVTLHVKADDNKIGTSYRIKVNVHQMETDSLYWSEAAEHTLPSRLSNPKRQKTVTMGNKVVTMIEESDNTYTIATTESPAGDNWTKTEVSLPFAPQIDTMTATTSAIYMLSDRGELYETQDQGTSWHVSATAWLTLIGTYGETVVGVSEQAGVRKFSQYPKLNLAEEQIPDDFPISGVSNFVTLTNKWTLSPVAFFVGGSTASGALTAATWAFDGTNWIKLSDGGVPELEGASVIPYYNFRPSAQSNAMLKYSVWMLVGGRMANGEFNRTVYISYDNGVNWAKGAASLQLPETIPAMTDCDNVVSATDMSANLSDAWKVRHRLSTRADYELDGDVIRWGCPYIYLFGGYAPDGSLHNTIWRGVLSRLTFTPII